jgi:hypothetical protein
VDETPVFVRAGAVIPSQAASAYSDARPLDPLVLDVYGSGSGRFELYEDDGSSQGYDDPGQHAQTTIAHGVAGDGAHRLTIEPTVGTYAGQLAARRYELRVHGAVRPSVITVNGRNAGGWHWDAGQGTASILLAAHSIRERLDIEWR